MYSRQPGLEGNRVEGEGMMDARKCFLSLQTHHQLCWVSCTRRRVARLPVCCSHLFGSSDPVHLPAPVLHPCHGGRNAPPHSCDVYCVQEGRDGEGGVDTPTNYATLAIFVIHILQIDIRVGHVQVSSVVKPNIMCIHAVSCAQVERL